jgi:hypothetical protein
MDLENEPPSKKGAILKIRQTVSDEFEPMLPWLHYCELPKVEEPLTRVCKVCPWWTKQ